MMRLKNGKCVEDENWVEERIKINNQEYLVLENIRPRHKSKCSLCNNLPEKTRLVHVNWNGRSAFPRKFVYCVDCGITFLRNCSKKFEIMEKNMLKVFRGDYKLEKVQ